MLNYELYTIGGIQNAEHCVLNRATPKNVVLFSLGPSPKHFGVNKTLSGIMRCKLGLCPRNALGGDAFVQILLKWHKMFSAAQFILSVVMLSNFFLVLSRE